MKITPEATKLDADPIVCEILASRMFESCPNLRSTRNAATVITATGIDVEIVSPARSPRYAFAAPNTIPNTMPNTMPKKIDLTVNSASDSAAGMYGR